MPKYGRSSRSPAGRSSSSGTVSISRTELARKISWPPGRSSRAASGIQAYGSHQMLAPYSLMARSKLASANGACSAFGVEEREPQPETLLQFACGRQLRWRVVQGRWPAPRRASQAET